jgi:RNA polymerase sigma-70 factor, ECF subfamily
MLNATELKGLHELFAAFAAYGFLAMDPEHALKPRAAPATGTLREEIAALTRTHAGAYFSLAMGMLRSSEDAQDAVQESLLKALNSLDTFDARAAVSTWVHRIVVTTCLMKLRSRRRARVHGEADLLPTFIEDGHQTRSSPPWNQSNASGIYDPALIALALAKIDELPEAFRETLMLRDCLGLSTEETATITGASIALVKTRLHRARQSLRTLLEPSFTAQHNQNN